MLMLKIQIWQKITHSFHLLAVKNIILRKISGKVHDIPYDSIFISMTEHIVRHTFDFRFDSQFNFYMMLYQCYMPKFNVHRKNVWRYSAQEEHPTDVSVNLSDLTTLLAYSMLDLSRVDIQHRSQFDASTFLVGSGLEYPLEYLWNNQPYGFFNPWVSDRTDRSDIEVAPIHCRTYMSRYHGPCMEIKHDNLARNIDDEIFFRIGKFWPFLDDPKTTLMTISCPSAEFEAIKTGFNQDECILNMSKGDIWSMQNFQSQVMNIYIADSGEETVVFDRSKVDNMISLKTRQHFLKYILLQVCSKVVT